MVNPRSKEYLKLNKNILVAFAASLAVSALAAQLLAQQSDHLNTTYTLIIDYSVYFTVFGGMFYIDNRRKYVTDSGVDGARLRRDLVKIITSLGIGEIVYTVCRWLIQYYLLTIDYDPYLASITGQSISTAIYMVVMNLSVRASRLFR